MQQWGLGTDVEDLRTALLTARLTRLATGSGFGQIYLLGWIDLFLADNARVRVWQPILRWLKSH